MLTSMWMTGIASVTTEGTFFRRGLQGCVELTTRCGVEGVLGLGAVMNTFQDIDFTLNRETRLDIASW